MEDIAGFLGSHPPFDALGPDDLARVAAVTEMESIPAGKTIFSQGAGPVEYLWVVRTGSVEIIHNGRILDLLAVIFQVIVMINLAWPRAQVYGNDKWYYQWGAFVFVGFLGGVGIVYYLVSLRGRPATVLAEHRAGPADATIGLAGEEV